MKWLSWMVLAGLLCMSPQAALADAKSDQKTFCQVSDFFGKNKALGTSREAITYTVAGVGGILAALINIEAQRKVLSKGLNASKVSLKAISWAGPLKAFGKVMIPLMDNTNKVIKSAELNSKTAILYKKVYTPASYTWMAINGGMYATQIAGVFVCKRATIIGLEVTKKGVTKRSKKMAALAKRYGRSISGILKRLKSIGGGIKAAGSPAIRLKGKIRPALKPAKAFQKTFKKIYNGIKPIFSVAKKLVKEMKKKRCITYGVKVKVKKKFWKSKAKKVKFCFSIGKVAGKIQKLAKAAQKPVNDIIKKTIKPLMKKIEKGLKKGLKLDKLKKFQKLAGSFAGPLKIIQQRLGKYKTQIKRDPTTLKNMGNQLR